MNSSVESFFIGGAKKPEPTRRRVLNGTATKTTGGLEKKDLAQKKDGRIFSKKASEASKKKFVGSCAQDFHSLVMIKYNAGTVKGVRGLTLAMKAAKKEWDKKKLADTCGSKKAVKKVTPKKATPVKKTSPVPLRRSARIAARK